MSKRSIEQMGVVAADFPTAVITQELSKNRIILQSSVAP